MSIIRNLYDALYNNLIGGGAYIRIIKGCIVTVAIFLLAVVLAVAIAALLTFLRTSKHKALRVISSGASFVFRGTPLYLSLLILYYSVLGGWHRGGFVAAVLALAIYGGGHLADILTRAVQSEIQSQNSSVNKRARREFFGALLPFVTGQSLFEIKRLSGILLQMSALVGVIGVQDLTAMLLQNGLRTSFPFFALACGAVFYLILQLLLGLLFSFLGKRLTGEQD